MNTPFYWLNKDSRKFLSRGYIKEGMTAEERLREIVDTAQKYLHKNPGFADRFYSYMEKGWFSPSSPIWSNFGSGNPKNLPISCNNVYVDDDIDDINFKMAEIGYQTSRGSGTSAYMSALRHRHAPISSGGTSDGPMSYAEIIETQMNIISQSNVRRGSCAIYLDVDHPDIFEFLESREEEHPIQKLSLGVCISDDFMNRLEVGDKGARKIWARIIKKRFETGYPYIFFTDTINRNTVDVYKDREMKIHSSNLCSEIALPSSVDESFVCDLASVNVLHYDEWKDTDFVKDVTFFLDAVMEEYIQKTTNDVLGVNVNRFARRHRAIGIGVLGWHSYLQSKMIAFSSIEAKKLNIEIFKHIKVKSYEASAELANLYGEPEVLKGYGRRNTTLLAVAPTSSSSFILGQVSPSIEPLHSNYFIKDLAKIKTTYRNPYLKKLLKEKGQDNAEVWESILLRDGSVQHLEFLDAHEKEVFKTFGEIPQIEVIIQASQRQMFIDQSQSLNIMIHHDTPAKDVSKLMIEAWKQGVKTLYYQRSTSPTQEYARELASCVSCEA